MKHRELGEGQGPDSGHAPAPEETDGSGPQASGSTWFLCSFLVFLVVAQTLYAGLYARSAWLRANTLVQIAARLGYWTLPVVVYLAASGRDVLDYLKLRRNVVRGLAWGLGIGAALVVMNVAGTYVVKHHVHVNFDFGAQLWWKGVILVGFSEEVVFRGFLLPQFAERMSFRTANLLQATMFLATHVPGWILLHQFVLPGILTSVGFVFLIGVVLGIIWKRSGSLWACIVIHSVNNFCSFAVAVARP